MSNKLKALNKDRLTVILATLSILLVSVAVVFVVRAFLTAQSEENINEFWPMTYTDTQVEEPRQNFTLQNGNVTIDKDATVNNPAGSQKKPVYVRMAVICKVYDNMGINVSNKYNCEASFDIDESNWQYLDGYYYYKSVLMPGASTTNLFDSNVTISNTDNIPSNYEINIDVIADTVQAVEIDSAKWTADDITVNCAQNAWNVTGTIPASDTSRESVQWS